MNNFPTYGAEPVMPTNTYEGAQPALNSHTNGLTKREYFAAIALGAIVSKSAFSPTNPMHNAELAVKSADALITVLNKEEDLL